MIKIGLLFFVFCFISSNALADWEQISSNLYMDNESLVVRRNFVRNWFKTYYPDSRTANGITFYYQSTLIEADCNNNKIRGFSNIFYDKNHNIIHFSEFKKGTKWLYVPPETVGATEYNELCKYRQ